MEGEQELSEELGTSGHDLECIENWRNCPSPDSPRKPVKSTAVVKYSTVQSLANFALLQCNTDLNLPPSNWLSSSADSYGLQHVPYHSAGFSSLRMAHMFPECVGEVDVVSDAENIKKLLKIPYSRGPVSMMVHRVENTLLIDEFDIHKHLLRTAESEWEWLKKFFYDHVLQSLNEKEKGVFHKNKSRCSLQQKSLVSKFLYHSLAVGDPQNEEGKEQSNIHNLKSSVPVPLQAAEPPLPEPTLEEELPDPASSHNFARNVVWTFEDIQMLIGTNLPIFGGSTHPCVSLKLRDVSKPINVLTGIDYWLDNLMCNVPELVMCYHLDGIVQKYELIKTEDLPHLENSKFSPKVIRDVAQNILSFLKSNATKAGHTYWLFKGKDAEIVKLYDLTSLCTDVLDEKGQNPFTVPVAMLLYRVARNMKHSPDGQRQQSTIRMLLENCIELLVKEKYPQIVTSAHYMLSDLYIPADIDPASPNLSNQLDEESSLGNHSDDDDDDDDDDEEEEEEGEGEAKFLNSSSSVEVKSLCVSTAVPASDNAPPPPLGGGVEERCKLALKHVAAGLHCLQYFESNSEQHNSKKPTGFMGGIPGEKPCEQENPKMARPFEAIPMPYSPLKNEKKDGSKTKSIVTGNPINKHRKKKDSCHDETCCSVSDDKFSPRTLLCKYRAEAMPTWQQSETGDKVFWKCHLKNLLYEKACLVYATLGESEYLEENYGTALRYITYVLHYQHLLESLTHSLPNVGLQSYLLGRAGDLCFMVVQYWARVENYKQQHAQPSDVDKQVAEEMEKDTHTLEDNKKVSYLSLIPHSIQSMEQMMLASCKCYKQALELEPLEQQKSNLLRRLGNIYNELGVLYMNQAAAHYQEEELHKTGDDHDSSVLQSLFTKSLQHLDAGIQSFEAVKDEANIALLHSNTGRLMRMCAHYHSPTAGCRSELTGQERHFYNKALNSYQKAIQVLGNHRRNPAIWDTVIWELSTTLFSMATLLQDFPSLSIKSQEEAEREVIEYLLKALKYCDLDTTGARQPVYQFRAASIHHRLASLYHKSYRCLPLDDSKRKNVVQLSKLHYEKASNLLLILEHPSDFLRVQLERVALAEFQAQNALSVSNKLKYLHSALELLFQTRPILKVIKDRTKAIKVWPDMSICQMVSSSSPVHKYKDSRRRMSISEGMSQMGNVQEISVMNMNQHVDTLGKNLKKCAITLSETKVHDKSCKDNNKTKYDFGGQISSKQDADLQEEDLGEQEEEETLLHLLEQRLLFNLLQIVKFYHGKGTIAKNETDNYKKLYSMALKKGKESSVSGLASHLIHMLTQVEATALQSNVTR